MSDANGAAFADYDDDGDSDVLIVRDGSDMLFANDGTGHFTDVSRAAGIGDDNARGMSASWGDYDGDGHLDVYVANYMKCTGDWKTAGEIVSQVSYYPDTLYHNNGDGTFSDVTNLLEHDPATRDDGSTIGAGFTAAWIDYNGDQRPDLYLANDFVGPSPDSNRLWRNDGPSADGWKFTDVSLDSGTALFMNTMGIGVADVDRDGHLDMALSNIAGNKLLRNDGNGAFVEDTQSGIERPTQTADVSAVTWGNSFYDFNLDGWEDLYMAAGNFQRAPGTPVGAQPNELFLNDGTGHTFLDVSAATGAADPATRRVSPSPTTTSTVTSTCSSSTRAVPHICSRTTRPEAPTTGSRCVLPARRPIVTAAVPLSKSSDVGPAMQRTIPCGSGTTGSANQPIAHFGLGSDHRHDQGLGALADGPHPDDRRRCRRSATHSRGTREMSIDNTERTNEPATEPSPDSIVLSIRGVSKRYGPGEGQRQHQHRLPRRRDPRPAGRERLREVHGDGHRQWRRAARRG